MLLPVLRQVGVPQNQPFVPDSFQLQALEKLEHSDVLVSAPTGSGKTWIAEQAIARYLAMGAKVWYASPLKALSNAKMLEFAEIFGSSQVGILTGDRKENSGAPLIVGTTEILRNQLYDAMHQGQNLPFGLVILDEAHYLGDADRGVVWEEVLIYLPSRVKLLLLSATIANSGQLAAWLAAIRSAPCQVVYSGQRPVPLEPLFLYPDGQLSPLQSKKERLLPAIQSFISHTRPPHPSIANALRVLGEFSLLPAIFFLKSRADCDNAVAQASQVRLDIEEEARKELKAVVEEFVTRFPFLAHQERLHFLLENHLAPHHAGLLPHFKLLVEVLMQKGLLKAIFSTSTVAAGVNFPARTVVISQSDRFTGQDFTKLSASELTQMTGRAGRRGMDNIGFCLLLPGPFQDIAYMQKLFSAQPDPIKSQLQINFSMVLNLLLSHKPSDVREMLTLSLAAWQSGDRDKTKQPAQPGQMQSMLEGAECHSAEEVLIRSVRLRSAAQKIDELEKLGQESPARLGWLKALSRGRVLINKRMLPFAVLNLEHSPANPGVWAVSLLPKRRLGRGGSPDIEFIELDDIYKISNAVVELPAEDKGRAMAAAVYNASGDFYNELTSAQLGRLGKKALEELAGRRENARKTLMRIACAECVKQKECLQPSSPLSIRVAKLLPGLKQGGASGLWLEFVRHLEFLRADGYVDMEGGLTADGRWASQLRLSQPVLIAEAIRFNALPTHNPALLAALLAWMADDRETSPSAPAHVLRELSRACRQVDMVLEAVMERLREWGFVVPPMSWPAANAVFAWGKMADLPTVGDLYGAGEGDVAQLIYRVADSLRQLSSLYHTHPQLSGCARQAVDLMIRPPILIPA